MRNPELPYSNVCISVFRNAIEGYHEFDDVEARPKNPYVRFIDSLLYKKCWIDTVQWHLEDLIRDPKIYPVYALQLKRRIDHSNQKRTDLVEQIDDWFLSFFREVPAKPDAPINTESPAWAIDRLSILQLKIFHMRIEVNRRPTEKALQLKLEVLLQQEEDLASAIDHLLDEIYHGKRRMKVYRQMKMYNDESLNPILYNKKDDAGA